MDETYILVSGQWKYLYRVVDADGQTIEFLLSAKRDAVAARRFLERAENALHGHGHGVDPALLQYLSPLGWEYINLTGDYLWRSSAKVGAGNFRLLRPLQPA